MQYITDIRHTGTDDLVIQAPVEYAHFVTPDA